MDSLHTLIASLEDQLTELREHAAKDVAAVAAEVAKAETVVRSELQALLAKLKAL